jgi:hypothetical protein
MTPLHIISSPEKFPLGEGKAWESFSTLCLLPNIQPIYHNYETTDIFSFPRQEKVVILGQKALSKYCPDYSLDKYRGTLLPFGNTDAVCSFHPQEAYDLTASEEDDEGDGDSNDKDGATTRPSNYFFWIRADVRKYLRREFKPRPDFNPVYGPEYCQLIAFLRRYIDGKPHTIYLDIECPRHNHTLNCLGLAIDDSRIVVIPFYTYANQRYYASQGYGVILGLLSILLSKNRVIIHNSLFDLFLLARYYRMCCGWDIYDTMLAHHRCFPESEKSLGHVISYWTWLPFHKDLSIENPHTSEQQSQLWRYNALDVYAMREVYKAQLEYLTKYDDIQSSVEQANAECYVYLLSQLQGTPVDEMKLLKLKSYKHRRVLQLSRICRLLSGVKGFNPASPKQCIKYFHDKLFYDVVGRTKTGQPQMNNKCLYKLRLKYHNPLLDAIIAYRVDAKALSMMNFIGYERANY